MPDARAINLTMDLCLRIGELLLSSGAGAADVTATMGSIARHYGLRNPEIDVTFTSLSMGYQVEPDEPPVTLLRQVVQRDIDYEDLTRVDHLVRDVLRDEVDLAAARATVARVSSSGHLRPRWAVTLGWGAMSAGVALMLGGGAVVMLIASFSAMCIDRLQLVMSRRRLPQFYLQVAGGGVATLLAVAATALDLAVEPSLVVTANIIMLLSGIGFMGALQDCLSGFYVTGGARIIEAMLATSGIIAGVSGGLAVGELAGVDVGRLEPGALDLKTAGTMALGAAICSAAFAFSAYSPKRVMLPIGVIGGTAMVIANAVEQNGFGRTWAVAFAALFIGLVAYAAAGSVRVPPLVVVVSTIVPLLPGLSIYRGLSLLAEGGASSSAGILAMVTAASVAIALASGVILGEYIAQPIKREARRLESRLAGPRLVGPLRMRSVRRPRRAP
ncbi:threonine/serine exporter family protein [Nocardioides donggukensis]|uniref:Threonine/serine exporter family protein n=1 Tax=Nocardioides donggukensis TaxID=2774019 RepID=A0A927K5A9_9ACTN|nr:threonine/serine exporter family protein [Nocardioides donggukensis]MBD8870547.1 threonine/serine exporter family protein [Nocardioides donggukensis]